MTTVDDNPKATKDRGQIMRIAAVTPSDSTDLPGGIANWLYIGTSGNVAVVTPNGSTGTFVSHPVGYMPGRIARVLATGTTASNILALY